MGLDPYAPQFNDSTVVLKTGIAPQGIKARRVTLMSTDDVGRYTQELLTLVCCVTGLRLRVLRKFERRLKRALLGFRLPVGGDDFERYEYISYNTGQEGTVFAIIRSVMQQFTLHERRRAEGLAMQRAALAYGRPVPNPTPAVELPQLDDEVEQMLREFEDDWRRQAQPPSVVDLTDSAPSSQGAPPPPASAPAPPAPVATPPAPAPPVATPPEVTGGAEYHQELLDSLRAVREGTQGTVQWRDSILDELRTTRAALVGEVAESRRTLEASFRDLIGSMELSATEARRAIRSVFTGLRGARRE